MIAHVITWIISLLKDWDLVINYYFTISFYALLPGCRRK